MPIETNGPISWNDDVAKTIIADLRHLDGATLPILHALQHEFGYIDQAAVPLIADALNFSRAEISGAISFYHDFRSRPPGKRVIKLCRAEACQANGCENLVEDLDRLYGIGIDQTTEDGALTLETVYCLGNCALGPSALVDGETVGRLDRERLAALCAGADIFQMRPDESVQTALQKDAPFVNVYLSKDSAALSVGADDVAQALTNEARRRGANIAVTRTGSRGMLWLEPLVEVETPEGRIAYGPVTPDDIASLFDAGFLGGGAHPLGHGLTEKMEWMARQQRLTFARVGVIDPLSLAQYKAHGGLAGLQKALTMAPADIIEQVRLSGLRGRGGAGFPTGIKWKTVGDAKADQKYIVCNADEGDSGTFADRMAMEGDPFVLIEGMAIAAIAVGATKGFIYLRSEYPHAFATLQAAVKQARNAGLLGPAILGGAYAFDIEVRLGAGAYICGEETSLLESLEGKRGLVRAKPPLPALSGLFGKPTVVNNVLSLAAIPWILAHGGQAYGEIGMGRSRGTMPVQIGGAVQRGGLLELAFGVSLRVLIEDFAGGALPGHTIRAVQIGGPLGAYLPAASLDLPLDYEALASAQAMLGHGGIVVFDERVNMAQQARFAFEFCAKESCGKCTPCRIGAQRGLETMDRIIAGLDHAKNLEILHDLNQLMTDASLCAMGGLAPLPVMSALAHFAEDFSARPRQMAQTTAAE